MSKMKHEICTCPKDAKVKIGELDNKHCDYGQYCKVFIDPGTMKAYDEHTNFIGVAEYDEDSNIYKIVPELTYLYLSPIKI